MCISIVASAFQYGCAPTLMPATTTLISPPAWVNVMIRRSTRGHPVHVLGAAVHRDLRAGRQREPLDRHAHPLGEVDGRDDPAALRLGHRAQRARRVAEEGDAGDALGVLLGRGADDPDHDARPVAPRRSIHRHEPPVLVEVVLDEVAPVSGEQPDELVGVDGAAPPGRQHLLGVVVERRQRLDRRPGEPHRDPGARLVREAEGHLAGLAGRLSATPKRQEHLLEPEPLGHGGEPPRRRRQLVQRHLDDGPDVEEDVVGLQAAPRGPRGLAPADALEAPGQDVLDLGEGGERAGGVTDRSQVADLGQGHEPLVGRVLRRDAVEEVGVVDRRQPAHLEVGEPARSAAAARSWGAARGPPAPRADARRPGGR